MSSKPTQAYANHPPGFQVSGPIGPGVAGDVSSGSPAAGSGNAGVSRGVCPLQSTVTVTTQYTVTVTSITEVASTARAPSPSQAGSTINGLTGPGSPAHNEFGSDSIGSGSPLENGLSAISSTSPKRTTCRRATTSGTAAVSASAGVGGLHGNGTSRGPRYPVAGHASSLLGPIKASNSSGSGVEVNTTATTGYTPDADLHGEFWAGGMYISFFLRTTLRVA